MKIYTVLSIALCLLLTSCASRSEPAIVDFNEITWELPLTYSDNTTPLLASDIHANYVYCGILSGNYIVRIPLDSYRISILNTDLVLPSDGKWFCAITSSIVLLGTEKESKYSEEIVFLKSGAQFEQIIGGSPKKVGVK